MLGCGGAYVSDLWTAPAARGQGLGARLLASVARDTSKVWQAGFIKLAVYHDNPRAVAFYQRLGFDQLDEESAMRISGAALASLGERA